MAQPEQARLTRAVMAATEHAQLHHRTDSNLHLAAISSSSCWGDSAWQIDREEGVAEHDKRFNWAITLTDDSSLTDPQHAVTLDWAKRLVWSLFVAPNNGLSKLRSFSNITRGLRQLLVWMIANDCPTPEDLTRVAVETYVEELVEEYENDDGVIDVTPGHLKSFLQALTFLWEQRDELAVAGIHKMPEHPFAGRTPFEVAKDYAMKPMGWWRPLPDEVAIPVINRATWFLGLPAEDVIRLVELLIAETQTTGVISLRTREPLSLQHRMRKVMERFEFSRDPETGLPWHPSLYAAEFSTQCGLARARLLLTDVAAACSIILYSTTGMRTSELTSLRAGVTSKTGMPVCTTSRTSATGLNEVFMLHAELGKTVPTPVASEWILAMRPIGSSRLPLPLHAILVLNRLYAPIRAATGATQLFAPNLSGKSGFRLGKFSSATPETKRIVFSGRLRAFIFRWVDLSGLPNESENKFEDNDLVRYRESKGRCVFPHSFRKAYANFALAVDSRLLPAVQMQFKHLSSAMTEAGYWGSKRLQIEPIHSMQQQQTALMMFEAATGTSLLAGRMGERIEQHIGELKAMTAKLTRSEAWKETVKYADGFDLRLWFAPHGKCIPLSQREMRCHVLAGTAPDRSLQPNYAWREPSTCIGCANFVLDKRHKGFWLKRFVEYSAAQTVTLLDINSGAIRVLKERAAQAKILLKKLGMTEEELANALEGATLDAKTK